MSTTNETDGMIPYTWKSWSSALGKGPSAQIIVSPSTCGHRQTRLTNRNDGLVIIHQYISDILLAFNTKFFQITKYYADIP